MEVTTPKKERREKDRRSNPPSCGPEMSLFDLLTADQDGLDAKPSSGDAIAGLTQTSTKPDVDSVASLSDLEETDNTAFPRPKGLYPNTSLHGVVIIGPPGVYSDECSMICAEFAFSHVSISNAPDEEDTDFLRSLRGITPAVACKSVSAQITRYMEGIKGQTEYRSKRLVVISGFPADVRAFEHFSVKFPWINVKAIVYFNSPAAVFAERVRSSKDFSPELDDVDSIVTDFHLLVMPLLRLAKRQRKLYPIEDDGQVGDVFTRVRGCILAVVVDHLTSIATNITNEITQSKAKNLEDFKKYQHEPVSSRKEDTERFVEGLQRDRELRILQQRQRQIAAAEEEEKKRQEAEEKKRQEVEEKKAAKEALARKQELEKAKHKQQPAPAQPLPAPPQPFLGQPLAQPFLGQPFAGQALLAQPLPTQPLLSQPLLGSQQFAPRPEPRGSYSSFFTSPAPSHKRQAEGGSEPANKRPLPAWAL